MPYGTKTAQRFKMLTKEGKRLRYAVYLTFRRQHQQKAHTLNGRKSMKGQELYGTLRLCFPHRAPDENEELMTVYDIPETDIRFSPMLSYSELSTIHMDRVEPLDLSAELSKVPEIN